MEQVAEEPKQIDQTTIQGPSPRWAPSCIYLYVLPTYCRNTIAGSGNLLVMSEDRLEQAEVNLRHVYGYQTQFIYNLPSRQLKRQAYKLVGLDIKADEAQIKMLTKQDP